MVYDGRLSPKFKHETSFLDTNIDAFKLSDVKGHLAILKLN